jgi:beta-glucosidase
MLRAVSKYSNSKEGFKDAIRMSKSADVAVLVVGDKSGFANDNTSGEMIDRATLHLPGVQEELVQAVYETGTPVVLVLAGGRPYILKPLIHKIPAVILAWKPGQEGGRAVADVIFGDYNPGANCLSHSQRTKGRFRFTTAVNLPSRKL